MNIYSSGNESQSSNQDFQNTAQKQEKDRLLIEQTVEKSTQRIRKLGPFLFNLDKVRPLLKDPNVLKLFSQVSLLESSQQSKLQNVFPHKFFFALDSHTGKTFRPSKFAKLFTDVPVTIAISHINFTNLTILNLSQQNLTSVQPLAFINAPKLACLEVYGNNIYCLEPLVKAKFPQLRIITFYGNPIFQMSQFYRIHNKKLDKFEFDSSRASKFLMEDYRFLFKMENRNFNKINVKNPKRIQLRGQKIFKKLDQPGTEILFFKKPGTVRRQFMRLD